MSKQRLDKAKRRAAGHLCMTLFHLLSSGIVHPLGWLVDTADRTGRLDTLGEGLTPNEREYVRKLKTDLHGKTEILRKLGWRFLGKRA